jgi:hypothetical protein
MWTSHDQPQPNICRYLRSARNTRVSSLVLSRKPLLYRQAPTLLSQV